MSGKGKGARKGKQDKLTPELRHLRQAMRKADYRLGLTDAVNVLIDDLPSVEYDDQGGSTECCGCILQRHGFSLLAELWETTVGSAPHGEPGATT